jgi:hypothetical protein
MEILGNIFAQNRKVSRDIMSHCSFSQREDDFTNNLARSILHQCIMKDSIQRQIHQCHIDDFRDRHRNLDEPIMNPMAKEAAIFLGRSNLSVNAAWNGDLRSLLMTVFKLVGKMVSPELSQKRKAPRFLGTRIAHRDKATEPAIPRWNPELIKKALESVHQEMRSELISIFYRRSDSQVEVISEHRCCESSVRYVTIYLCVF